MLRVQRRCATLWRARVHLLCAVLLAVLPGENKKGLGVEAVGVLVAVLAVDITRLDRTHRVVHRARNLYHGQVQVLEGDRDGGLDRVHHMHEPTDLLARRPVLLNQRRHLRHDLGGGLVAEPHHLRPLLGGVEEVGHRLLRRVHQKRREVAHELVEAADAVHRLLDRREHPPDEDDAVDQQRVDNVAGDRDH